jgi:PAS domain S-box-containing protein
MAGMREGDDLRAEEWEITRKDGAYRTLAISTSRVETEGGIQGVVALMQDVTERRQVEQAFLKSESLFRTLAEVAPVGIYRTDPSGAVVYLNDQLCEICGFCREVALDCGWMTFVHPDDRASIVTGFQQAVSSGQTFSAEYRFQHLDGRVVWVISRSQPEIGPQGESLGRVGTLIDITARKRVEQDLTLAHHRTTVLAQLTRELADCATLRAAALLILQATRQLIDWDSGWIHLWNEEHQKFEDLVDFDLIDGECRELPSNPQVLWEPTPMMLRVMQEGPQLLLRQNETDQVDGFRRIGNLRRSLSLMYVPIHHAGRFVGILSIQSYQKQAYDQSALELLQLLASHCAGALARVQSTLKLRTSEERFRLLAENIREVFWVASPDNQKVDYISPAYEEICGRSCASLYADSMSWLEFVHPEDREWVESGLPQQIEDGYDREYRIVKPDGSIRWIRDRTFPVRTEQGQVDRIVGLAEDITERKRAEKDLALAHHRTTVLAQLTRELADCVTLRAAALLILQAARQLIDWDCSWIHLWKGEHQKFDELADFDLIDGEIRELPANPEGLWEPTPMTRRVMQEGPQLLLRQNETDQVDGFRLIGNLRRSLSSMFVPIHHMGHFIGILSIQSYQKQAYDQSALELLQLLASHCAGALARIQASAELRESEERYRLIADLASSFSYQATITADNQVSFQWVSGKFYDVTGYRPEELSGPGWFALIPSEDLPAVLENVAGLRSPETDRTEALELRILARSGEVRWLRSVVHPLSPSRPDEPMTIYGAVLDITDRKRAEEALQKMRFSVDHAGDSMFWVCRDGRILYVNDAACAGRGYSREEMLGMTVFDLDPDFQSDVWDPHFEELKRCGTLTFETRHRAKDGRLFPIEVNANYVHIGDQEFNFASVRWEELKQRRTFSFESDHRTKDGRLIHTEVTVNYIEYSGREYNCAMMRDITERKRHETLLRGQNQVLEMIAANSPLSETLTALLRHIEAQSSEMLCSILLLDADGTHLRHGAAPSLPEDYTRAIDGVGIGPCVGSCGTAAFRREAVIVEDIENDPLWADFRGLALPHRLRACWSTPIFDAQNRVLGTFAMYYRQPCRPTEWHRQLIEVATQSAAIAIGQKREQDAFRESEERFQAFMNQSPVVAWAKDEEFRFRYVNAAFEQLFDMPASQILGRTDYDIYGKEFADETRANDITVLESGEILDTIEHVPGADGRLRQWLVQKFALHRTDRQTWVGGTAVDVTSRREAEQALRDSESRFRLLFEGANDAIFWADAETGLLTHCNPAAEALLGRERAEVVGQPQAFLHPPEEAARYREIFMAHASSKSKAPVEAEVIRKDGRRVAVSISPSVTTIGEQKFIQGIFRDITERKQAEKELALRQAELLHVSRLSTLGQMVGALSHEVAQPLSAIGNFAAASARLLESTPALPSNSLIGYIQAIVKQNRRCGEILQRLRDFSRHAETRRSSCDINQLLHESAELVAHDLRRHDVTVRFRLATGLPPLQVDRVQLQQVVVNLLTNARDAVCDLAIDRRRITVRSRAEDDAVVFEVEDLGTGLAEDAIGRLFDPFFTTKTSGMGLGLNICQSIIREHGGQIEAFSNNFGGATFRVRLPLTVKVDHV